MGRTRLLIRHDVAGDEKATKGKNEVMDSGQDGMGGIITS